MLETFRIKKDSASSSSAHEPMVVDPIQMAFDEDGRLYVVEMRWYQSETRTDLMFDERIGGSGCSRTSMATAASTRARSSPTGCAIPRR